jgi:hypothetical protein
MSAGDSAGRADRADRADVIAWFRSYPLRRHLLRLFTGLPHPHRDSAEEKNRLYTHSSSTCLWCRGGYARPLPTATLPFRHLGLPDVPLGPKKEMTFDITFSISTGSWHAYRDELGSAQLFALIGVYSRLSTELAGAPASVFESSPSQLRSGR